MTWGDYNPFSNPLAGPSNCPPDRLQMYGYMLGQAGSFTEGMRNAAYDTELIAKQQQALYECAVRRREEYRLSAIEAIKRQPFFGTV